MGTTEETLLKPLAEQLYPVEIQGNTVSSLKASSDPKPIIDAAIQDLNALKLNNFFIEKSLQSQTFFCRGKSKLAQMV